MIAFRKDWDPNNKDDVDKFIDKLKVLLGGTNIEYDEEDIFSDHDDIDGNFYASVNLSEILNLIYQAMYQKNHKVISVIINKNENNSLDVSIDPIK